MTTCRLWRTFRLDVLSALTYKEIATLRYRSARKFVALIVDYRQKPCFDRILNEARLCEGGTTEACPSGQAGKLLLNGNGYI